MNAETKISRASLLISQGRYKLAQDLLQQVLMEEPENARAHSWLALCLTQDRDRLREATREAEHGVSLSPDDSFSHYILAIVWEARNQVENALKAVNEAIAINPYNAQTFSLRSNLYLKKKDWNAALDSAEEGLALDPEDDALQGLRVIALERLGRISDARQQAEAARQQDPDSSWSHASLGHALLNQGDYRGAQKSFAEALRLEPGNELARSGLIQALNSSNFLYRWTYLLLIKVSRLSPKLQWPLLIGVWGGIQLLASAAETRPWLVPWVMPISLFYLLFAMMSWVMQPLFNTMLRFHSFGRHLLSNKEKWASNLIAGTIVVSVIFAASVAYSVQEWSLPLIPLLTGIYMMIPISIAFQCEARWTIGVATVVAVLFGLIYLAFNVGLIYRVILLDLFHALIYGVLVYCFASILLIRVEEKV